LIGRARRVPLDRRDALERHRKLFRGDLRDGGHCTRAELDLAGVERHHALAVDRDEAADLVALGTG
jgi:hypothetical protein